MNDTQKAAIHELLEIALTTPKEVADITMDFARINEAIYVRLWFGGYVNGKTPDNMFHAYTDDTPANGVTPAMLLERVKKAIESQLQTA